MSGVLGEMLLIEEPSVLNLYREMVRICSLFVAPLFLISLVLEYFGMMDFPGVSNGS